MGTTFTVLKVKRPPPISDTVINSLVFGLFVTIIFLFTQLPPISTWNGKPNKFLVYYGDQRVAVNTSLAELLTLPDRSPAPVKLKNLDPGKNYTVSVAMCTAGGCGNMSEPCFILENNEDDSDTIG